VPRVPGGIVVRGILEGANNVVLMSGPGSVWKCRGPLGSRGERAVPKSKRPGVRAAMEAKWIEKGQEWIEKGKEA